MGYESFAFDPCFRPAEELEVEPRKLQRQTDCAVYFVEPQDQALVRNECT
jgi:hypothetical protein